MSMTLRARLFFLFLGMAVLGHAPSALAAVCNSTGTSNWSNAANWSCGVVPAAGDSVTITLGNTVTLDTNTASLASLTVAGTLSIGSNATGRTLTVAGDITVSGTITTGATNATHTLLAGGNISNSGTINLRPSATRVCNVTFNRNGSQTVSGAGAYTFNLITLNMGATRANVLDMQSVMTVPSPFLTITNGTYKHSNTSNITPWTADPNISATGGFWLNAAATVTTTGFNVTVNGGQFRISAGTMSIGNANTTLLVLGNVASTLFQMDGGALSVTGGINSSANTATGTFAMSGGTITLMSVSAGTVYSLLLGSATTLNWSGGTIVAVIGNNTTDDVDIRSAPQNVTGGTLQIGSVATSGTNQISLINGAGGALNVWNLVLASGIVKSLLLRSTINVLNDLTIQANNTLDNSAGNAINIGGGNVGGTWSNNGAYTQGASTVTFTGSFATPAIAGTTTTTFNNLTINKASNNLTINTSPTVNGTLTFTNGDIVTGANRVILGTAATIATASASSYVVGSLQKNYNAGAVLSYFAGNDFPVGDAANYTPVNISAGTTTTAGSLTISALTPDHPQVTTPIASTGIDATKSVNRYWRFNNSGLTVGTALTSTFTFVAGDIDTGATTANFIVQRYDGSNWNPTSLVTANPLNTQASNITPLAAGNNDFAVGEPLAGVSGSAGAFNVFEASTPANAILGRIYTKIVGTAITLQVVAVNAGRTGVNVAYNTNPITVELLDARNNTGAIAAATACRSTWTTVISTQSLSPVWTSGRSATITITAPVNAWRDVRARVTQGANIGCSTDRFAIRPTAFSSVTSTMNNNGTSGAPSLKTGQNFTVSALTGLTGYDNGSGATLASPALIPLIDNLQVVGSPTAGALGGSFNAASNGTATGAAFFYSEVGNFGLNANAIYDNVFTVVDQPGDCTADFSNALVGGQYGCKFGSTAVAQTTGVSGFGRFVPDNFDVSFNAAAFGAACVGGAFSYVGQAFSYSTAPVMTVTARNGTTNGLTNTTTTNYAGAYMKITNATLTPNTIAARYSRFDALGGGTTPALDTSNVPGAPGVASDPVIGAFAAGVGSLTFGSGAGLKFIRSTTTPSASFAADMALALNVIDADGVAYGSNPAQFGAAAAGNGMAFAGGKEMRYGRLKLSNAVGSELLDLPVQLEAQYWSAAGFITNASDSCTTIAAGNIKLGTYNPAGFSANVPAANVSISGALVAGRGNLKLLKPSPATRGSLQLCVDLDAGAGGDVACQATTPANMGYLQGAWTSGSGYIKDPSARVGFAVYKGADQFIYMREDY